jgi:spore coat protein H
MQRTRLASKGWAASILALVGLLFPMALARPHRSSGSASPGTADALFTNGVVRLLKIEIPKAGLRSLDRDARTYVRATLREGNVVYTNCLIRLKGNAGSFQPVEDKPGLTVRFDEAGTFFHGLNKIHLNNSVQDSTCLSEWLCSEIFREAGVPAPRAAPVLVELNGRRLGLYVLLESVDRQFLARYFKNTHGNVYSPSSNADIDQPLDCIGGHENNLGSDLKALASAARASGAARLPQVLDMDRFISFLAVEVMLCHWDGYTFNVKNYLVYHNLDTGKMVFIPHDMDQMLGDPGRPVFPSVQGMVSQAILQGSSTRTRYWERFRDIDAHVFIAPVLTGRLDALVVKLSPQIKAYDPGLAREFVDNAQNLKARVVDRARNLRTQLDSADGP